MRTIGVGFKVAIYLLALTSFSILLLTNYSVYAEESSVSTATVTINQSCSMVGTTNTAHTANLANGTYSGTNYPNGIGQTTLKAYCNDSAGFAIYAIGYTGNEYGNTKLHNDTLGSTYDISTGTYTSGTTVNSTWSMKLTSVSGDYAPTIADGTNNTENFTTWHTIPTEYTKVAYRTSTTDADNNGQGSGSSLTTTYDAYVSATQPAGTYIGQVKYTLVHPNMTDNYNKPVYALKATDCPANSICYAPNASDIIGSMDSISSTKIASSPKAGVQVSITSNTNKTLIAPNYKRDGYGFAGWSTDYEATDSSTIYGPNETITVPDVSSNGLILYPVWIIAANNMQDWDGCSSLTAAVYDDTTGEVTLSLSSLRSLRDTRDGNVYTIARLADENCWMIENLRLNAEDSRGEANIVKAQGYSQSETYGDYIGLADSEDSNFSYIVPDLANVATNSLYSSDGSTLININDADYPQVRTPRYNRNNTNMVNGAKNSSGTNLVDSYNTNNDHVRWYSYGNYYSWPAAVANTIHNVYGRNTSICPSGWGIPRGAGVAFSFSELDKAMGGTGYSQSQTPQNNTIQSRKWRAYPNNYIFAGYYNGSSTGVRGSQGYYWTAATNNYEKVYVLGFSESNSFYPGTNNPRWKYEGLPIRCVFIGH